MIWKNVVLDFTGLITKLAAELGKYRIWKTLKHDKSTIERWLRGGHPEEASDVGSLLELGLRNGIDVSEFQAYDSIYDLSPRRSYEEKLRREPPDMSWLTCARDLLPEYTAEFCGLKVCCPLGIASCPLTGDDRWTTLMLDLGFGLSTFKTRRTGEKESWHGSQIMYALDQPDLLNYNPAKPPEVVVTDNRSAVESRVPNLVNSIGVPSEGTNDWQGIYERIKRNSSGGLVGISVMGDGKTRRDLINDFEVAVEKAKEVHPPYVELNLSCPNLEKDAGVYDDPQLVREICLKARRILNGSGIRLLIKLPHLPAGRMHALIVECGARVDGVVFRNTVRVRPVELDRENNRIPAFKGRQFGGFSGPGSFEMTLRGLKSLVSIKKELNMPFEVIAAGGATTTSDVLELLGAGANVVQAATAPMFDPLMAWKIRFRTVRVQGRARGIPTDVRIPPRNDLELQSYDNAVQAREELRRRFPRMTPSKEVFQKEWNSWMEEQTIPRVGVARRTTSPRTVAEWVKVFSHEKSNRPQ